MRILYGATIFLGAFLLFAVEPMAAKQLLPALGGSSAVWITCLVFFQTALLLGYLYAHWLSRRTAARMAVVLHISMLVLAVSVLVFVSQPNLSAAAEHPLTAIFQALTLTIGLPFLLLASTSPLLQLWLARQQRSAVPWKLFALSNAGSLLALVLLPHADRAAPFAGCAAQSLGLRIRNLCCALHCDRVAATTDGRRRYPGTAVCCGSDAEFLAGEAALVPAAGRSGDAIVRRHQPSEPEYCGHPALVGAAAGYLSADVYRCV